MNLLLATTVLLLARGAAPQVEGSVGVGGGYDSNVDLAPSSSALSSFGTSTFSAWAELGAELELSSAARLYAGVRYDGVLCPGATDLSRNVPGGELSLTYDFTDWLAVSASPGLSYAFFGDPARSALQLNVAAVARVRPWRWLSLRAGYARAQSWASAPVFSLALDRLLTSAEIRLARRTYLAVGYALSSGDQVFYRRLRAGGATGASGSRGHVGSGAFAQLEAYQAGATEDEFSIRVEQGIWRELYVAASYAYTLGSSVQGSYTTQSGFGAVGYRF